MRKRQLCWSYDSTSSKCGQGIAHSLHLEAYVQVFGRTMVCKDMDVALKVAHKDNLDGITMEGIQVNKKGVLKGGFYDVSRLVTYLSPYTQPCILNLPASMIITCRHMTIKYLIAN